MAQMQQFHWWYKARRALVRDMLHQIGIGNAAGKQVLDVGCGAGEGAQIFPEAHLTGLDPSEEALALVPKAHYRELVRGSGEQLVFPSASFDVVLLLDALEHMAADDDALREARRVLRPGGVMCITVPAYQWLWSKHDEAVHHKRRYTRQQLVKKMEAAGFTVRYASYYMMLFLLPIALFRFLAGRFLRSKTSDFFILPNILNVFLYGVSRLEAYVCRKQIRLPFGTSIIAILVAR